MFTDTEVKSKQGLQILESPVVPDDVIADGGRIYEDRILCLHFFFFFILKTKQIKVFSY